jgi:protein TonB
MKDLFDLANLDQIPVARFQARPVYPFEMRRAGITGEVLVGFIVDSNGDVRDAYAIRSNQREFEAAAIQAVMKWKFRPGRKGGRAVNTRMQVPIVFSITD